MLTCLLLLSLTAEPTTTLPDAVRATVVARYPKAVVKRVEQEHGHYEVTLALGTDSTELSIEPSGKLLSEERVVPLEQVAPAVRAALAASVFKSAKVERVEKVTEGNVVTYEFVVRDAKGARTEVVFDEAGALKERHPATE